MKNEVNSALERALRDLSILTARLASTPLSEEERALVTPLLIRIKTALDQAGASLAIARHTALQAVESL